MKTIQIGEWIFSGQQEIDEGAEWLENDAAYLSRVAAIHHAKGADGDAWAAILAEKIKDNADHSAALAAQLRRA